MGAPLVNYPFSVPYVMRGCKELISVNECIVSGVSERNDGTGRHNRE